VTHPPIIIPARRVRLPPHLRRWLGEYGHTALRRTVEGLLLIAIAVVIGQLVIGFRPDHRSVSMQRTDVVPVHTPPQPAAFAEAIVRDHLFGAEPSTQAIHTQTMTRPNIGLEGILFATRSADSSAVLSVNGSDLVAQAGSTMPGGVQIVEIDRDRVVLNENGTRQSLMLKIPQADPNAKFTPLALNTGISSYAAGEPDIGPPDAGTPDVPPAPRAVFTALPTDPAIHEKFQSLRALRGRQYNRHFSRILPKYLRHPPRPP